MSNANKPSEPVAKTQSRHSHMPGERQGDGVAQGLDQEQQALEQMGDQAKLNLNEGGRTNDSSTPDNPEGAVHGLPQPALRGTWR